MKRTWVLGMGTVGLAAVLAAAAFAVSPAPPARAETFVPADGVVLATVDRREPAPTDPGAAIRAARRHIERARRDADPRYLGRAQAALAPWWHDPAPPDEVLLLRATIRQALHDFTAARADLDELIRRRPDDAQARLTRAVVATVTGDVAIAAADCDAIAPRAGELIAAACAAPLGGADAYRRLTAALAAAPAPRADVIAWAEAAAGDLARQLGDDRAAEAHFDAALAAAPADVYTLGALADLMLDHGRAPEVLALLADHAGADPLLLRLAIAGRDPEQIATLRARFDAAIARGDHTHLREHARFVLAIDGDAARALVLARAGWELQKEPADARILRDAARAWLEAIP